MPSRAFCLFLRQWPQLLSPKPKSSLNALTSFLSISPQDGETFTLTDAQGSLNALTSFLSISPVSYLTDTGWSDKFVLMPSRAFCLFLQCYVVSIPK
jgi:hypothetical protein